MTPRAPLRLLAALAFALPALTGAGPRRPASPAGALPAWPPPPEPARVRYVGALARGASGGETGMGARMRRLFTGTAPAAQVRLVRPTDVYAEDSAHVYVTDAAQSRVFVMEGPRGALRALPLEGAGAPSKPMGLSGDGRGRIYVTDPPGRRVVVLDRQGRPVRAFGGRGVLLNPVDVAVDTSGGIAWVVDSHLHQVLAFDGQGRIVRTLGRRAADARSKSVELEAPGNASDRSLADVHRSAAGSRDVRENRGGAPGEFLYPCGAAVAADGTLYVCDGLNGRVQVFTRDGGFVRAFGRLGDVPGTFARPKGIALDRSGNVYVVDAAFNNVQVFDAEGRLLLAFAGFGNGPGELWLPLGLGIDRDDRIYVADRYNARVQMFAALGTVRADAPGSTRAR